MAGYDLAALIINRHALENHIPTHDLCNGRNTKELRKVRKSTIHELRERTDLSWTEINNLMGRAGNCRRC